MACPVAAQKTNEEWKKKNVKTNRKKYALTNEFRHLHSVCVVVKLARTQPAYRRNKPSLSKLCQFTLVAVCHHALCVLASSRTSNYDDIKVMHILSKLFFVGALVARYAEEYDVLIGWVEISSTRALPSSTSKGDQCQAKNMQIHLGFFCFFLFLLKRETITIPIWFFNFVGNYFYCRCYKSTSR